MNSVIFHNVTSGNTFHDLSFAFEAGNLAALITSKQEVNDGIVRLLLGLELPESGSITVLDSNIRDLTDSELHAMRRNVGVMYPSGGLVSNLKVWENVLLPLEYHDSLAGRVLEERGTAVLRLVGYEEMAMELPGNLSLYSRRLVGQARAFIMEPDLIIYNAVLGGLNEGEKRRIVDNALAFHRGKPGRTSVFLTSQPETVRELPLDACLTV
jgi:phospholipid/cholesterol/gamma-HCH transport system ATP-binding protein